MKRLEKLLLGIFLLGSLCSSAQTEDTPLECKRMRLFAQQERKKKNYLGAAYYELKAEEICGKVDSIKYDASKYKMMIATLRNAVNTAEKVDENLYYDTLSAAWDRMETAGFYNSKDDFHRALALLQKTTPNRVKADKLFRRGIDSVGTATNEAYISYFYYNTYAMFSEAALNNKEALKEKMITEYFELSKLISVANMSIRTQETITSYFNNAVKSCNDILPNLKGYMEKLPENPEVKKVSVLNFINLLEKKECTESTEYLDLIDIYVMIDPTSFDAQMVKAKALLAQKKYSSAISTLRTAKNLTPEGYDSEEITYQIARAQYQSGSYSSAYNTAMSVRGVLKGKALIIAGSSVGKNANNCGSSSFERQCNNIYAVQLLQQAKALGESTRGAITSFKSRFPSGDMIFENGSPTSVILSCYGVSVNPKK
jgi:tetratricopeptide (TPR) repeat protein